MPTVATAYVQVMPSMEGATTNITDAILPQIGGAGDKLGKSLGTSVSGSFGGVLTKLLPAATVAGLSLAAVNGLKEVGEEFDAMTDAIVVGTGASGEALDSLVQSAKNIGTEVPADFENIGDVVQNLNTRLGVTGDDLEDIAERVIAVGNMLGTNVDMDRLTGAFNAFGVANEDAASKMDYLFNVGQQTGIGFNELTKVLEANAPALQNLGFTFEQSANMAGLLDKAGMDANGIMSKMSKALVSLSKPGESAADAFRRVVGEMQSFIDTGDTAAAVDIASTVFGTRGAAQFVGALQSGALSMEQLMDSSLGAGDGIMETMDKTLDWDESLQVLGNNLKVALEPMASGLLEGFTEAVKGLTEFVKENSDTFQMFGQALGAVGGIIVNVLGGAFTIIGGLINGAVTMVELLGNTFDNLVGTVQGVWDTITGTIGGAIDKIKGLFKFDFKLPELKLPHIVVGEYIDVPVLGRIPNPMTLRVDWYAKGGIVGNPTLIGAGEAGPEAIVPLTAPNLAPFAEAVASAIDRPGIYIENMNVEADDVDELIMSINRRLVELGAM